MTSVTTRVIPDCDRHTLALDCTTSSADGLRSAAPSPPGGRPVFARLGSWCFRKRRRVAVLWVLGIVVVGGISSAVGGNFGQDFEPPGLREHPRHRHPRERVRRPGRLRASRARSCSAPSRASTTPRCRRPWSDLFDDGPDDRGRPRRRRADGPTPSPASTTTPAQALEDADLSRLRGHHAREPLRRTRRRAADLHRRATRPA